MVLVLLQAKAEGKAIIFMEVQKPVLLLIYLGFEINYTIYGVHVMTVLPGFVYTKMTAHLNLPKPLTAKPDEVADAIYNGVKNKEEHYLCKMVLEMDHADDHIDP